MFLLRMAFRLCDIVVNCHNYRQMSEKDSAIRAFKATFSWTWVGFVLVYPSLSPMSPCTTPVAGRQAGISGCSREHVGSQTESWHSATWLMHNVGMKT